MLTCAHCGQPLPADVNFCSFCGNPASAEDYEPAADPIDETIVRPAPPDDETQGGCEHARRPAERPTRTSPRTARITARAAARRTTRCRSTASSAGSGSSRSRASATRARSSGRGSRPSGSGSRSGPSSSSPSRPARSWRWRRPTTTRTPRPAPRARSRPCRSRPPPVTLDTLTGESTITIPPPTTTTLPTTTTQPTTSTQRRRRRPGTIISWPAGTNGYTIILKSTPTSRGPRAGRVRRAAGDQRRAPPGRHPQLLGLLEPEPRLLRHVHRRLRHAGQAEGALPNARSKGFPTAYVRRVAD